MNPSVHTDDARFVALLERWLQGDFTRADERELHALTEADDFRREAWEGFIALPEGRHELHLQSLRRRLRRQPGGKRAPLVLWAAAAATFAMLLVALYFFPPVSRNQAPMAAKEAVPAGPETQIAQTDSAGHDPAAAEEPSRAASSGPTEKTGGQAVRADEVVVSTEDLSAVSEEALPEQKKEAESVVAPAPSAVIRFPDSASGIPGGPASSQQNFPASLPPGGPAQNVVLNKPETARYDPSVSKPAETRSQPRTETSGKINARETIKKESDDTANGATPAGGWDHFSRYLRDNARLTEAARNNNVSGYVRLQFWVGQDGRPANITVLRSLGYGCDEEAKRLVNSVMWTPAGPGPTTVEVPFVR